jgi:hypothetical protein
LALPPIATTGPRAAADHYPFHYRLSTGLSTVTTAIPRVFSQLSERLCKEAGSA